MNNKYIIISELLLKLGEKTWDQIRNEEDPNGIHHDLRLICTKCRNESTCRCTKPKRVFYGICPDCTEKNIEEITNEPFDLDEIKQTSMRYGGD